MEYWKKETAASITGPWMSIPAGWRTGRNLKAGMAGTGSWVRWMSWKRFSAWRTMSPGCGDALAAQMAVSGS